MTKRTLYAQLVAALLGVCFLPSVFPHVAFAQPPAAAAPCASCLVITIRAGQKLLLPEDLGGLTILVRTDSFISHALSTDALAEIDRRAGKAAILIDPFQTSAVPDNLLYRLKLS